MLPKGTESTGLTEVLLDKALPDRQRVLRDIIVASNLNDQVPASFLAPLNARLVVDTRLGQIWFDGIQITELKPGTHAFLFVKLMANNANVALDKHELAEQLSASRTDGDQSARSAKMKATKIMKSALEGEGKAFVDPFRSENGSYRLVVPAWTN